MRSAVGAHENLLVTALDVTDPRSAEDAAAASIDRFGRIDVLVNNAGRFVIDQHVDAAEAVDGGGRSVLGAVGVGHVELGDEEVLSRHAPRDGVGVAAGGDDVVAGGERGPANSTPMPRPAPVINQVFVMDKT